MEKIPVILDGDPGHDDAIAWLLAASSPQLDIRAVISVGGNVSLKKTTLNALRCFTLFQKYDIRIAEGAERPLLSEPQNAPSVHGESGLDGPAMPESKIELSGQSGLELMAEVLRSSDKRVTIIPTGPLTNIANLIVAYPELIDKIERISLMGGGILSGNWTHAAEFNILVDPEAARVVFGSGIPIIMAPLDVTEKALILAEDVERIRKIGNRVSDIVAEWLDFFYKFHKTLGYAGAPLHDPCAVGVIINPDIFVKKDMYVEISVGGEYTRGATLGDYYGVSGKKPNATVIMNLDREKFVQMLIEACESFSEAKT
ncbi:MAG: nucleoside hydrolase [Oscillospiraceae bacterium]